MFIFGVGLHVPVHSSSWAGLVAGSERSGIGGLLHVAGVSCESVENCVYMGQGNLECINGTQSSKSCNHQQQLAGHKMLPDHTCARRRNLCCLPQNNCCTQVAEL